MSDATFHNLLEKLTAYKKKFFTNQIIKGAIFSAGLILSLYILINFLEYFGNFNQRLRFSLFSFFTVGVLFAFVKWIAIPIYKLLNLNKELSDEEAAFQIGKYFPQIGDKLLNTLQLRHMQSLDSQLIAASIAQKTQSFSVIPFSSAIDYKENNRYGRFLFIPFLIILLVLFFIPKLFLESTARIIRFDKHFAIKAPFDFLVNNKSLKAFKNEDFKLSLHINGNTVPESAYILVNNKRSKMLKEGLGVFTYTFRNVQAAEEFTFEAAGFNSEEYNLEVLYRPALVDFNASLTYPAYLKRKDEQIKNLGNLVVPQGTKITWHFKTTNTNSIQMNFEGGSQNVLPQDDLFSFSKTMMKSENYKLKLLNRQSSSAEDLNYLIDVIPDQFPVISLEDYKDTAGYRFISLGGSLSDDYGLSKLKLNYRIADEVTANAKEGIGYKSINVSIDQKLPAQNYLYNWALDSLKIIPGHTLQYYLEVWDNDQVNGSKSARTQLYDFKLPSLDHINEELTQASNKNEQSLNSLITRTEQLKKNIENMDEKFKNKSSLNWQDKKMLEDILKQQTELKNEVEKLSKENKNLNEKNEQFNPSDPALTEKIEQLQKLMNELVDEETKKLYEDLQKLLEENLNKPEIEKILEQLRQKDENLENELERTLEMFKELKFEQKIDETVQKLKDLAEKEQKLSEKTGEKSETQEKLSEEQEKLNDDFKKVEEQLNELSDINESMENKKNMKNFDEEKESIKKEQEKSSEQLKSKENKKAAQSQKSAADKMKQMQEKLADMKEDMAMEQMQENLDDLRAILENLITLSFEQETLMKDFRKLNQSDPRFITLSQKQLKLKDDSKIIEDSLLSLAKRVFQIESFVTREVSKMKGFMDESTEFLKDRRPDIATGKQQFAMTSINNLALLLNDALKQMQQQMANAMKSGGKMCNKPSNKPGNNPGLSDLQKQLNQKIQELQKSGKSGRAMSEELAKLAAQQEMIRNALKKLDKKNGKGKDGLDKTQPGSGGNEGLSKEMQETEKDLVNKQLNQITITRQKEILTRLLEAEKAAKERELDNKREAKSADDPLNQVPPNLEKYLKDKESEIDLLKTISPQFTPYFKQQVNDYFQKIEK